MVIVIKNESYIKPQSINMGLQYRFENELIITSEFVVSDTFSGIPFKAEGFILLCPKQSV